MQLFTNNMAIWHYFNTKIYTHLATTEYALYIGPHYDDIKVVWRLTVHVAWKPLDTFDIAISDMIVHFA